MRALVVLDSRDMPQAQGLVLEGQTLSPDVFPPGDCIFELCLFPARQPETVRVTGTSQDMTPSDVAQRYGALVVVAGHHAVDNAGLKEFVRQCLFGGGGEDWSNEAAVVLTLPGMGRADFHWPAEHVFTIPSAHDSVPSDQDRSAAWIHLVRGELDGVVRTVGENQTRNPNVGFGLLVVDSNCNFFLMERLRDPGRNTLGTMGGNFERGHNIDQQLQALLTRRFGPNRRPQLELGPLLSCTNMKNSYLHYVDITFLALLRQGSVRGVWDDELIPLRPETLEQLPKGSRRSATRYMFTLPEVATFHREDRLFTPVANAFESFCRTILADQLRYGRKPTVAFPSLLDESSGITVHLPSDIDCVRDIISAMPWSTSTIPFFEGYI